MKNLNLYKLFAILFIAISTSCVDNNDYEIPVIEGDNQYTNLVSLSDIVALYQGDVIDFNQYIADNNLEDINTYGYVVSDDREGNFFKTLIIQDKPENPTVGVEIRVDATNVNAIYNVGRKVYIKLKGLAFGKYFENYQLGASNNGSVDRIDELEYRNHIERSSELAEVIPTNVTIGQLTNSHINTLIQIDNVQPETTGLQYSFPEIPGQSGVNRIFKSCETFEKVIMRTSIFANFQELFIPDNNGSITAVVGKFRDDFQLYIRDTNDLDLTQDYGCNIPPTDATLAEVKAFYTGSGTATVTKNLKIKLVVTSDLASGNTSNRNAFAQDATAGIALRFSEAYDLNLGDEIEIAVGGATLSEFRGLLQLNISNADIINKTAGTLPTPEVITIAQALSGEFQGKLVSIEGVQFKDITKTYENNNILTSDCDDALTVFVSGSSNFAGEQVSDKKGTVTGVVTSFNSPQLYIRNTSDINFTEDYACGSTGTGGTTEDLYISEYAEGSSNNKYIEIYNGTGADVDLTNYTVGLYGNGSATVGNTLDLSTVQSTLANGQTIVIYNGGAADAAITGYSGVKVSSNITFYNGDDAIALLKSGTVIDVVGNIGEDPGSFWAVGGVSDGTRNHTLVRKASVTKGNTDWASSAGTDAASSEWEVKAQNDFASIGVR